MRTRRAVTIAAIATIGVAHVSASASAATLGVRDEGYLHFVSSSGSQVIDEGRMHGRLPGYGRVRFTYDGSPYVSASFTISGSGWSLRGYASAKLNNPNSAAPSFRGHLTLSGGSGRYAHARGSGEMFGVFYRRNYALTVQAIGRLRY